MIHLSSNLNVKYDTIYRKLILDYSTKQFDLIKYIGNIESVHLTVSIDKLDKNLISYEQKC